MLTIEQLKANYALKEKKEYTPSKYYPFFKMNPGEQVEIRIVTDKNEDNPMGFSIEKVQHILTVGGDKVNIPCIKTSEVDCPICSASQQFYKNGDKEMGKMLWKKSQQVLQAIIINDPLKDDDNDCTGQLRYLTLGYQISEIIREAISGGELDHTPDDVKEGCNFIIKKTMKGKFATYQVGSKFLRKSSALTKAQLKVVKEDAVDLSTLLPTPMDPDKVNSLLIKAIGLGGQLELADEEETNVDCEPTGNVEEVDAIMEKIKSRQSSKV